MLITVSEDFGVIVVITRDCGGVVCGEEDGLSACVNAQCVDPSCSPTNPSACADALCSLDSDCGVSNECGVAACTQGTCFTQLDHASCESRQCLPSGICDVPPPQLPPIPPVSLVSTLSVARSHMCLLREGTSWCWGDTRSGQLGDGTTAERFVPQPTVDVGEIVAVAAGGEHTCHLSEAGQVLCSGGQQGTGGGFQEPVLVPDPVSIRPATQVVTGENHSCALLEEGAVRCWGNDYAGQIGDADAVSLLEPAEVVGLTGVVKLGAGLLYTCALTDVGDVYCWGSNEDGQRCTSHCRWLGPLVGHAA